MRAAPILISMALVGGCGSGASGPGAGPEWKGTITTVGDVTTVVNESGSVWGGDAFLVEEASIGALEGSEEVMLGSVSGFAYDGERIFIADAQVPIVRVYDGSGAYLRELGGAGQGPGEYEHPASVALAADGRILVRDDRGRRILVYAADGEHLETYPMSGGLMTGTQMVIGPEGVPYTIVIVETPEDDPSRMWILGMQAHGPDGPHGEPIVEPSYEYERGMLVARREGSTSMNVVPFWPAERWTLTPELDVISGVSTAYRFEIARRDGSRLVIERRDWSAAAVQPDEADWYRRRVTTQMRGMVPEWTWNGPAIPDTKPPFSQLIATDTGEVWVLRPGPGERIEPCAEDAEDAQAFSAAPCWRDSYTFDAFGPDGRYLGSLEVPAGMSVYPLPRIRGDELLARVEDEMGTVYVKRFRRVLASAGDETT